MSLMQKIAQLTGSNGGNANERPKFDPEDIKKLAAYSLNVIFENSKETEDIEKKAELVMEKLSAEEVQEVRDYVNYGRGLGYGEQIGKEAGIMEATERTVDMMLKIAANRYGEDVATTLYVDLLKVAEVTEEDLEAGEDEDDLREQTAEAAAQMLIEDAGGPDNIDEETAGKIREIAELAGDMGVQQAMQGGEDEGAPQE